jgi:hypothetical protein
MSTRLGAFFIDELVPKKVFLSNRILTKMSDFALTQEIS